LLTTAQRGTDQADGGRPKDDSSSFGPEEDSPEGTPSSSKEGVNSPHPPSIIRNTNEPTVKPADLLKKIFNGFTFPSSYRLVASELLPAACKAMVHLLPHPSLKKKFFLK